MSIVVANSVLPVSGYDLTGKGTKYAYCASNIVTIAQDGNLKKQDTVLILPGDTTPGKYVVSVALSAASTGTVLGTIGTVIGYFDNGTVINSMGVMNRSTNLIVCAETPNSNRVPTVSMVLNGSSTNTRTTNCVLEVLPNQGFHVYTETFAASGSITYTITATFVQV